MVERVGVMGRQARDLSGPGVRTAGYVLVGDLIIRGMVNATKEPLGANVILPGQQPKGQTCGRSAVLKGIDLHSQSFFLERFLETFEPPEPPWLLYWAFRASMKASSRYLSSGSTRAARFLPSGSYCMSTSPQIGEDFELKPGFNVTENTRCSKWLTVPQQCAPKWRPSGRRGRPVAPFARILEHIALSERRYLPLQVFLRSCLYARELVSEKEDKIA